MEQDLNIQFIDDYHRMSMLKSLDPIVKYLRIETSLQVIQSVV